MTGLLIKVEHHPEDASYPWIATMWRDLPAGVEYVAETTACGATRDEAVADCQRKYEALETAEPVEWLRYTPPTGTDGTAAGSFTVPEPQSLKAV